ncbi:hypothetical protein [Bartonella sp. AC66GZZY]
MWGISISESTQDASYELFQVLRGGNIHELARYVMGAGLLLCEA